MTVAQGTPRTDAVLTTDDGARIVMHGRVLPALARLARQLEAENAALSAQVVELQDTIRNARVQREAAEAHVESLQQALKAAQCPDPKCSDGMITNTGPDPQHDQCEWCYGRHLLVDELEDDAIAGSAPHDASGDESFAAEGDEP